MRDEIFYKVLMNRVLNRREFNRYKNIDLEIIVWMEEDIPTKQELLTADDKDLLESYAPRLFEGIYNARKAYKNMFELVKAFYAYRYENSPYSIQNDAHSRIPTYKNQSAETKADKIQAKAGKATGAIEKIMKPIVDLMAGETLHTPKSEQLKRHYAELIKCLKNAEKDPLEYIPTFSKPKNDKKAIEAYLFSLKLQGKSNVIKAFITAIK